MSMVGVSYWQRRDTADRGMLGQAAYDLCKALRASGTVEDGKFYWAGPDTVVLQVTADAPDPIMSPPNADCARSIFGLADLADRERFEVWIDPRTGMMQYDMAGR
jgi:hypothetical protein